MRDRYLPGAGRRHARDREPFAYGSGDRAVAASAADIRIARGGPLAEILLDCMSRCRRLSWPCPDHGMGYGGRARNSVRRGRLRGGPPWCAATLREN
jgi:hypothetical protein